MRNRSSTLVIVGVVATILWLLLCLWYIGNFFGWSTLGAMLPHELAAIIAGVAAPPALLWLVLVFAICSLSLTL